MLELSDDVTYIYEHVSDLKRACLSEIHLPFRSYDFKKFLSPLNQQLIGDNRDIAKLVGFIKERATLLEWSSLTIDGPGITTALRLLCHLCVKGNRGFFGLQTFPSFHPRECSLPILCQCLGKVSQKTK